MQSVLRPVGLLLILLLTACGQRPETPTPAADTPASVAPPPAAASGVDYRAAVDAANRLAADREQDARRKPAEVLAFFGVQRGMSVLDLFSGGGYYSELLATVVGPTGRVVAHNNSAYLNGLKEQHTQRYGDPQRLPNVERLAAEGNELELEPASFDFVLLSNVYHDFYYADPANGWPAIDGARLLAEIFASMKPGATLGLTDHAAAPGSPAESGGTLHRIDPELVKRDFAAAGFVFDAQSDVLRNPGDDLTKGMFDPAVRGQTDRFILRFRKP